MQWNEPRNYTVIDLEMTGLSAKTDKIIEIGAVRYRDNQPVSEYSALICPQIPIPQKVAELTGITDEMLAENGIAQDDAVSGLLQFIGEDVVVGHNVIFDYSFLKQWATNNKRPLELMACDTLKIARVLLADTQSKTLEKLCEYYQIARNHAHRALDDSMQTGLLFEHLKKEMLQSVQDGRVGEQTGRQLFEPKKLQYKAKRQTPVTTHQVRQIKEFQAKHNIPDTICWETLTRNEASRIMDRYYSQFGHS